MKRYIVDATITLHERPDMGQFEVGHYEGDNLAKAIAAMAGAAADDEGKTVHEVVLRVIATPSTAPEGFFFDDDGDLSLDDCIYWPRPEADCSGRMAYRADPGGNTYVCERHVNHPPTL